MFAKLKLQSIRLPILLVFALGSLRCGSSEELTQENRKTSIEDCRSRINQVNEAWRMKLAASKPYKSKYVPPPVDNVVVNWYIDNLNRRAKELDVAYYEQLADAAIAFRDETASFEQLEFLRRGLLGVSTDKYLNGFSANPEDMEADPHFKQKRAGNLYHWVVAEKERVEKSFQIVKARPRPTQLTQKIIVGENWVACEMQDGAVLEYLTAEQGSGVEEVIISKQEMTFLREGKGKYGNLWSEAMRTKFLVEK